MVGKVRWWNVSLLVIAFVHVYILDANATTRCICRQRLCSDSASLDLGQADVTKSQNNLFMCDGLCNGCYGKKQ